MPSTGAIKARIKSIEETQKITSAMHVVSASKLNIAKRKHRETSAFFDEIKSVMIDILQHSANVENQFFDKRTQKTGSDRNVAVLVFTGDKGLSGGYDNNVCKKAVEIIKAQGDANVEVLIAGRMGQDFFRKTEYKVNTDFIYPVQNPTVYRARDIGEYLQQKFNDGEYDDIYLVYTKCVSSLSQVPMALKLLPLDLDDLKASLDIQDSAPTDSMLNYEPSPNEVFKILVTKYMNWIVYTTFVEAYSSELSARMTAMKTATDNAEDMLEKLNLDFNRARQAAITQEITEIIGGAADL